MTTQAEWSDWRLRAVGVLQLAHDLFKRLALTENGECVRAIEEVLSLVPSAGPSPIPMILNCPMCCYRHIDEGEFATKPHHTHACQGCGFCWRPAVVHTAGVRFLPGFKNAVVVADEAPPLRPPSP